MNLHQHNPVRWAEVVIAAEAAKEPFEDVTIVTARSCFADLALQAAADLVYKQGHALTDNKVKAIAQSLIASQKICVQEHVRINEDGIIVCLDVADTQDEYVMWRALDLLADALDKLNGKTGVVVYGEDLRFTLGEVPWLVVSSSQPSVLS